MPHPIKTIAKETCLYSLGNYTIRGCAYLVTLFLHTKLLTPSSYSVITEFYSYIALGQVVYLAMDMTYCRFVPLLGKQYTFNITVTVWLLISILLSITIFLTAPYIAKITDHVTHLHCFYYVALILPLDILLQIIYTKFRIEHAIIRLLCIRFIQVLTNAIFTFLCYYFPIGFTTITHSICHFLAINPPLQDIDIIFMANLLGNIFAFSFVLSSFKGFCWIRHWCSPTLQTMGRYVLSTFFTTLFASLNNLLPLLCFRKWLPYDFYGSVTKEEILGSLGITYKLTACIVLGIQAFKYAVEPLLFSYADRENAPKLYSQIMYLFLCVSCLFLLFLSLNINWIVQLLIPNVAYRYTIDALPYLAWAHVCLGIYYNFTVSFKINHQTQYTVWISACGTFLTAICAYLLIPKFGYWGVAYTAMSSAAVMALLGYYIGKKYYPIPYYKKGFVLLLLTFSLLGYLPLWPRKFFFLGKAFAYLLLNSIIIFVCWILGRPFKKVWLDQETMF